MNNKNKVVLITGGSQGIGAACVLEFAKAGYDVAINCFNQDAVEQNGRELANQCIAMGVDADCFIADVSDFKSCAEMVKHVITRFGSIDVLINNAGITKDGLLARMSEESYDIVIAVNQKGVFNMLRHVSPIMIKQRGGRIINLSSVSGVYGNAGQINYSASKAAVVGMTLTASKELGGRGITVNALAPGFIETPMTDVLADKVKEVMLGVTSLKRFGKAEEVAKTALFLASDGAAYITGQIICIDGGMMI